MPNKTEVQGLAELDKALQELGAEMGYKALRVAGRKAMRPVLDAAIAGANEDTGELKQSIAVTVKKGRGARGRGGDTAAEISVGPTRKSVMAKQADGSRARKALNMINIKAITQEYGTKNQTAKPFLRPALSQNVDKVISNLRNELAIAIEKAAKKVAKQ